METRSRKERRPDGERHGDAERKARNGSRTDDPKGPTKERAAAVTEPEKLVRRGYATHVRDKRLTQDDHLQARRHGRVFAPPHLARCLAYGARAIETTAPRIHIVDACCGFGTAALAALARIGEYRRWHRVRSESQLTITLIEKEADLAAEATEMLKSCDGWARAHNLQLHVRTIVGDMLHDHAAMKSAAGGTAGPPAAVLIVPPVTSSRTERREHASVDWSGRRRARTGSPYSEFCEAALELLEAGGEICAVTPASWTVSEDYEPFRRRLRQNAHLRRIDRFRNHATLWGQQSVTFDTIIWFATKTGTAARTASTGPLADPTPLETITHADRERWTTWRQETEPGRKWLRRPSADGTHNGCERLNTSEDGLSERLLTWRLEAPRLEDLGLWTQAGSYDDFQGHGTPGTERRRSPERTDRCCARYISAWHIGRRELHWPGTGEDGSRDCANWINDAPRGYVQGNGLERGWYAVVRSTISGRRSRRLAFASAIGPDIAASALMSKRAQVIGWRDETNSRHPRPMGRNLARGIAAWLTSTPIERAAWPNFGSRINRANITEAPWPAIGTLEALGKGLTGHETDDEIDEACLEATRAEFGARHGETAALAIDIERALRWCGKIAPEEGRREIVHETTALTLLALKLEPRELLGRETATAAAAVLEFAKRRYGRAINHCGGAFIHETVFPWMGATGLARIETGDDGAGRRITGAGERLDELRLTQD